MNEEEILKQVKIFVEEECKKPSSHYGAEIFFCHFIPMVSYAKRLSRYHLNVDKFVVEVAAWMHDIGSIMEGRVDHHISGRRIAGEKLKEWGVSEKKIWNFNF